ncbi:MAG TPA: hypothetical protein ENG00_01300 [Candidatus Aenigmarchaeota archaeon]|nr:hypothetical protein [Candidatus Aenigmarchaeota archaeon]
MNTERDKPTTLRTIINELIERTGDATRRLRVLEQSIETTDSRIESIEKDILNTDKQMQKSFLELESKIRKQQEKILQMENTIREIIKQMKKLATSAEIGELEELIEIYNPLKSNFVTRDEVERMIEERLSKQ